jgi:hypothetical protein
MAADAERAARSARIVAAAQHAAPALAPLPLALVLHILSLLPVDCRLLCVGVCRSWRAALEERSLWIRLDLSASGVSPNRVVTNALLHAAAARARGELVALDLRGCTHVKFDALLAAVTANGALREVRTRILWSPVHERSMPLEIDALEALLRAAPRLAVCDADVECHELALAHCLLRNEPPFPQSASHCACALFCFSLPRASGTRRQCWRPQPNSLLTRICNGFSFITLLSTQPLRWMRWWTQR